MNAKRFRDEFGFNVIQIRKDKKAIDGVEYSRYFTELYEKPIPDGANIGVVLGRTSDNLFCFDVDAHDLYKYLRHYEGQTFITKTGKKGYHIFFKFMTEDHRPKDFTGAKIIKDGKTIELFLVNRFMVLPPSFIEGDSLEPYKIISDVKPKYVSQQEFLGMLQMFHDKGFTLKKTNASNNAGSIKSDVSTKQLMEDDWPVGCRYDNGLKLALRQLHSGMGIEQVTQEALRKNSKLTSPAEYDHVLEWVEGAKRLYESNISNGSSFFKPTEEFQKEKAANSGDDVAIKIFNVGKDLIRRAVNSLNDTEQIAVQVLIHGKPHWLDIFSTTFTQMVRLGMQEKHGRILARSNYDTAITNLHASLLFNGSESQKIHRRCALVDGTLYYDLQDADGTIYKISKDDIRECQEDDNVPIFLRSHNSGSESVSQPKPLFGNEDALNEIVKLFRIDDNDKILFKSHFISYFLSGFPIPIAVIHGEQGSAKTSSSAGIKSCIDPDGDNRYSLKTKEDDLAIILSGHDLSNFDNIESFEKDISNFLCKVVTGTDYMKRGLYTNADEFRLRLKSKVILNGISPSINQPDLLERSIFYELPKISKDERMTDQKFEQKLNELKPSVLGVVFQTIQKAMRIYDDVDNELDGKSLPRMASFAVWGEAISRALGHEPNAFIVKYDEKLETSNIGLRDEYPIMDHLMSFIKDIAGQEVTMSTIFDQVVDETKSKSDDRIPKDAKRLGKQLKQLAPVIRDLGYEISTRTNNSRNGQFERGVTVVKFTKIAERGMDAFAN